MDPAKQKRVLKLLAGRRTDREQAIELLIALEDDELWRRALTHLRTSEIVGIQQVAREDVPLLAAAPAHLPEVRALRSAPRSMYFNTVVSPDDACFTHLEHLSLTAAWGNDDPKAVPTLALLAHCPVHSLDLIGVDLEEGRALVAWPLRVLKLRGGRWSSLPVLRHLEELEVGLHDGVSHLGEGLPALRRLSVDGGLTELSALAGSRQLEEVRLEGVGGLTDLGPLAEAAAAGAPLRTLQLLGATALRSLEALSAVSSLERVEVEADVGDLSPLLRSTGLTWLGVRQAPRLRDLRPVATFAGLSCLDLRGCSTVTDLTPLLQLADLRVIALADTGVPPGEVPAVLQPYCTWAAEPGFTELVGRPRHPDDPRGGP